MQIELTVWIGAVAAIVAAGGSSGMGEIAEYRSGSGKRRADPLSGWPEIKPYAMARKGRLEQLT